MYCLSNCELNSATICSCGHTGHSLKRTLPFSYTTPFLTPTSSLQATISSNSTYSCIFHNGSISWFVGGVCRFMYNRHNFLNNFFISLRAGGSRPRFAEVVEESEGTEEDDEDVKGFKFLRDLGCVTYDSGP